MAPVKLKLSQALLQALLVRLSESPCETGMRLVPQRDLADTLGVTRNQVRFAFKTLVERGILTHRRGSGVYVRKVAKAEPEYYTNDNPVLERLSPELLFANGEPQLKLRAEPQKLRLRLGLWHHGPHAMSQATRLFHQGVRAQAEDTGHEVRVLHHEGGEPEEIIRRAFRESEEAGERFDGYLVLAKLAPIFAELVDIQHTPTVFTWMGPMDAIAFGTQPLIWNDLDSAHRWAIDVLLQSGGKSIGLLGLDDREPNYDSGLEQYRRLARVHTDILKSYGKEPGAMAFCTTTAKDTRRAMIELLDGPRPVDALYVADDVVLQHANPVFDELNILPGRDVRVISIANNGIDLPAGRDWSRMEINPYQLGRLAVQSLVRNIQTKGEDLLSFSHQPHWVEGDTHLLNGRDEYFDEIMGRGRGRKESSMPPSRLRLCSVGSVGGSTKNTFRKETQ